MRHLLVMLVLAVGAPLAGAQPTTPAAADTVLAARFARLALACVDQEYPNKIAHVLQSDVDAQPPRVLTPAFHGCFDWHSAMHGHWLLVRLARSYPDAPFAADARAALARSLTPERIAGELAYFAGPDRQEFERPYGLAWLLQLGLELREWDDDPQARAWSAALRPLEAVCADRLRSWLPKLRYPIRTGEHSQTAFALALALDWARAADDDHLATLITERAFFLHAHDRGCPLAWEPGGQDFLSPCLAEADLLRRLLAPEAFAAWLADFLPELPVDGTVSWLPVAEVTDRTDGKLAHLDGLNLSRAWMLEGIAAGLPAADPRRSSLLAAAAVHAEAGLAAVTGEHYAGGHWLGSFATYLVTRRGLS